MLLGILLAIYSILQFLVAPIKEGIQNARRNTVHVYGIPMPPIARVISILALLLLIALSALVFIIGKIYYGSE